MPFSFRYHNYKQKSLLAEVSYLVFIGIISPLAIGLQIFSELSFTLSNVLVNILTIPAIVLFYRLYLPCTIGRKRYLLALMLFPFYILIFELILRLGSIAVINIPFVPDGYRNNLKQGHPEDFTTGYFHQSFGWTSLVLLAATSLYVIKLLFKSEHNLFTLETEKLKIELDYLKSQLRPHFFFNTLNNLYSLSIQSSPKAPDMITHLSEIMRYVLYEAGNEKVMLQQEINFIKSYINLENLRHSQTNIIDFSIQGEVRGIRIEPLLFLPIIENTFKHALHKNMADKWVKLVLSVDEEELIFQTTNPKAQLDEINDTPQGGIGLTNVKQRLKLLYPDKHELVIHDDENSFTVTLVILYND